MELKKITRVAIFIDYDNFFISYMDKFHKDKIWGDRKNLMWDEAGSLPVWDKLNENLMKYYQENFIKNDFEVLEHIGTYLCVGISEMYGKEEARRKDNFREIDRKNGFIVKYGHRLMGYKSKKDGKYHLGKEKGVDAEIICQMLMGAF